MAPALPHHRDHYFVSTTGPGQTADCGSSVWFCAGVVVAYDQATRHGVLNVPDGPMAAEPAVRAA